MKKREERNCYYEMLLYGNKAFIKPTVMKGAYVMHIRNNKTDPNLLPTGNGSGSAYFLCWDVTLENEFLQLLIAVLVDTAKKLPVSKES